MSAFGGARGAPAKPPEKGIFPLDHFGECKQVRVAAHSVVQAGHATAWAAAAGARFAPRVLRAAAKVRARRLLTAPASPPLAPRSLYSSTWRA